MIKDSNCITFNCLIYPSILSIGVEACLMEGSLLPEHGFEVQGDDVCVEQHGGPEKGQDMEWETANAGILDMLPL